ncbi:hypothetical protein EON80_17950, partial [bacterium]
MPLRLSRFISLFALATSLATISQPSQAQRRGRLSSRSMPLRLTLARYGNSSVQAGQRAKVQTVSYATYQAPRRITYTPPVVRAAPVTRPIALGAYFYQNGQSAPGDMGAVAAWKASAGRMPAVWMIYQGWTGWNQFPVTQAKKARQLGGQLMVTWEPWDGSRGNANWSCASVANGSKDAYIRRYARTVKSAGVPVMIRLAHEMNGDWYPWGTAYTSGNQRHNLNSPGQYVAMWRRVVQIFRQEGANNAAWVWSP